MTPRRAVHLVDFEPTELVRQFIAEYEYASATKRDGGIDKTVAFYKDQLRPFLAYLQRKEIESIHEIDRPLVLDYMLEQKRDPNIGDWSVSHRFRAIHTFGKWLENRGEIDRSFCAGMPWPKISKAKGRQAFTRDEVKRMWKVLNAKPGFIGARDRAMVAVLLGTGLRASELAGMRWEDLNVQKRTLRVVGKGNKERYVQVGAATYKQLTAYIKLWQKKRSHHPQMWLTLQGRPASYSTIEAMVRHLGEYAGVEDCIIHRFRHTFATEYYLSCRDVKATQFALGHSRVMTTENYLRALGTDYALTQNYPTPDGWLVS